MGLAMVRQEKVAANERIRETQAELGLGDGDRLPFLCECEDVACRTLIRLTSAEYREVRAGPDRFVLVEGHPHEGRIVSGGEGYLVAES
jgi:hypothetical protein